MEIKKTNTEEETNFEFNGRYASSLAVLEVGLGSLLHSMRVPLAGQILSLSQIFILARALKSNPKQGVFDSFQISVIASLLKTLSPAGKKLTPMLAISMQGFLFSLGLIIFGNNIAGAILGAIFACVWAFVQPLFIYYLFFGSNLFEILNFWLLKMKEVVSFEVSNILHIALLVFFIKALASVLVVFYAWRLTEGRFEKILQDSSLNKKIAINRELKKKTIFSEVLNPFFLLSLLFTALFLYFSQKKFSDWLLSLIRPLAVSFLIVFLMRKVSFDKLKDFLMRKGFVRFSKNLNVTLERLKK